MLKVLKTKVSRKDAQSGSVDSHTASSINIKGAPFSLQICFFLFLTDLSVNSPFSLCQCYISVMALHKLTEYFAKPSGGGLGISAKSSFFLSRFVFFCLISVQSVKVSASDCRKIRQVGVANLNRFSSCDVPKSEAARTCILYGCFQKMRLSGFLRATPAELGGPQ